MEVPIAASSSYYSKIKQDLKEQQSCNYWCCSLILLIVLYSGLGGITSVLNSIEHKMATITYDHMQNIRYEIRDIASGIRKTEKTLLAHHLVDTRVNYVSQISPVMKEEVALAAWCLYYKNQTLLPAGKVNANFIAAIINESCV